MIPLLTGDVPVCADDAGHYPGANDEVLVTRILLRIPTTPMPEFDRLPYVFTSIDDVEPSSAGSFARARGETIVIHTTSTDVFDLKTI